MRSHSAHSKRRSIQYKKPKSKKRSLKLLGIFGLLLLLCNFFVFSHKLWNGRDKYSAVINNDGKEVWVVTFDPANSDIITFVIPGNTEVEVAKNLGVWKLGNVWELGNQEKIGGELLAKTLTKHFSFPVYLWADKHALGLIKDSPVALIQAVLYPYKTNISLADRLQIAWFSLRVKNTNREVINLNETSFLKKTTFVDGEAGFVLSGISNQNLTSSFADPLFYQNGVHVLINDNTGEGGQVSSQVGEVIEVLGGKVAAIVRGDPQDISCEVSAKEKKLLERMLKYFPCAVGESDRTNFDLEITLGTKFVGEY